MARSCYGMWVYGYALAVLHAHRRHSRWINLGFVSRLIGVSMATFARYRSPIPRSEWRLWALWIRHALRGR